MKPPSFTKSLCIENHLNEEILVEITCMGPDGKKDTKIQKINIKPQEKKTIDECLHDMGTWQAVASIDHVRVFNQQNQLLQEHSYTEEHKNKPELGVLAMRPVSIIKQKDQILLAHS